MVQGEARIGLIWESNGKFLQANGLVGRDTVIGGKVTLQVFLYPLYSVP
jgi:hypothetical protein